MGIFRRSSIGGRIGRDEKPIPMPRKLRQLYRVEICMFMVSAIPLHIGIAQNILLLVITGIAGAIHGEEW